MSALKQPPQIRPNINGNIALESTLDKPNELSATQRVFRVPELTELILFHLGPHDLLHRVTLVCRSFKQIIASSPGVQQRLASCILVDDKNPTVQLGLVPKGMMMSSGVTGWRLETHMQYYFQCDWTTGSSNYYTFTELGSHAEFRRLRIGLGSAHALQLSWSFTTDEEEFRPTNRHCKDLWQISAHFTLGEILDVVAMNTAIGIIKSVNMTFWKVEANDTWNEALASHRRNGDG